MKKKIVDSDGNFLEYKKGFVVVTKDPERQEMRYRDMIPYKCPACENFMQNLDDSYFFKWGVCSECAINYLEDRSSTEHLKHKKKESQEYVKLQIENKNKNQTR